MSKNKEKSYAVVLEYQTELGPEPDTMLVTTWAVDRSHALGIAIGTKLKPEDDILSHRVFELDLSEMDASHEEEIKKLEKDLKSCRKAHDTLADKLDGATAVAEGYLQTIDELHAQIRFLAKAEEEEDTEVDEQHKKEIEELQSQRDDWEFAYKELRDNSHTQEEHQGSCGYDEMLALIEENKRTPYLMAAHLTDLIKKLKKGQLVRDADPNNDPINKPVSQDCLAPYKDIRPSEARWENEGGPTPPEEDRNDYKVKGTPDAITKIAQLEALMQDYRKKHTVARKGLSKALTQFSTLEDATRNGDDARDIVLWVRDQIPNYKKDVNMHLKSSEINEQKDHKD